MIRIRSTLLLLALLAGLGPVAGAGDVHAFPASNPLSARVVYASKVAGVKLDSNLTTGGGTPSGAALNVALATATSLGGLELVIDGPILIEVPLKLQKHTTITFLSGAGLYCKTGLNGPALRNAHWVSSYNGGSPVYDGSTILDSDIRIRGPGYINCNRGNGTTGNCTSGDPRFAATNTGGTPYGSYVAGMAFHGVKGLTIEGVTLYDPPSFGLWVGNLFDAKVADFTVFDPLASTMPGAGRQTGGIQVEGPADNLRVSNSRFAVADDSLALNAADGNFDATAVNLPGVTGWAIFGGRDVVYGGPITRVKADAIKLDRCLSGIRLLPGPYLIDQVEFQASGTAYWHVATLGNFGGVPSNGGAMTRVSLDLDVDMPNSQEGFVYLNGYGSFLNIRARRSSGAGTVIAPVVFEYASYRNVRLDLQVEDNGAGIANSGGLVRCINSTIDRLDVVADWTRPSQAQGLKPLVSVESGSVNRLAIRARVDNCGGLLSHTGGTLAAVNVADSSATNLGSGRGVSTSVGIGRLSGSGNVGVTTSGTYTTNTLSSQ